MISGNYGSGLSAYKFSNASKAKPNTSTTAKSTSTPSDAVKMDGNVEVNVQSSPLGLSSIGGSVVATVYSGINGDSSSGSSNSSESSADSSGGDSSMVKSSGEEAAVSADRPAL